MLRKNIAIFIILLLYPFASLAHPGNTAADGCHYCRTNCDSWGEAWNVRHCHGGSSYTSSPSYATIPYCPANSYYSNQECVCNNGYGPSLDKQSCIKIPTNAYYIKSTTDVWLCNIGYKEIGNQCIATEADTKIYKTGNLKEIIKESSTIVNSQAILEEEKITNNRNTKTDDKSSNTSAIIGFIIIAIYLYSILKNK